MEHACRLLAAGSLPVRQVAAAVGYEDPFYFSRVFKSVVQVSPSEYRARSLAKEGTQRPSVGERESLLS